MLVNNGIKKSSNNFLTNRPIIVIFIEHVPHGLPYFAYLISLTSLLQLSMYEVKGLITCNVTKDIFGIYREHRIKLDMLTTENSNCLETYHTKRETACFEFLSDIVHISQRTLILE